MTGSAPRKKHIGRKVLAALIAVCAALLLLSRYGLEVTRFDVSSPRLPRSFDGFRIVQLSDLHGAVFGRNNDRLVEKVAAEAPDLIALTGDFLDEGKAEKELPALGALIARLSAIAPVFYVTGNHDWASGRVEALAAAVEENGGTCLRNEAQVLTRGDGSIVLAGAEDPNGRADQIAPDALCAGLRAEHPDAFLLLLAHRNYWMARYPDLAADLVLCGHSHGGVIRLPGLGGLLGTEHNLLPEYDAGLFANGHYSMIVSRGLGSGGLLPRFLNTPQLVTIILHSA
jgi:predicted MPP superfamily phosphohydrolase